MAQNPNLLVRHAGILSCMGGLYWMQWPLGPLMEWNPQGRPRGALTSGTGGDAVNYWRTRRKCCTGGSRIGQFANCAHVRIRKDINLTANLLAACIISRSKREEVRVRARELQAAG